MLTVPPLGDAKRKQRRWRPKGDIVRAMAREMCGGNEVVKRGGVYVCQHCGTKYCTEEARKLLVEISGPVSVDGVATADNLLDRAQEFLDKGDRTRALEYVDRVLDIGARNERDRDIQRTLEYGRVQNTTTRGSRRPERLLGGVAIPEEKYQSIVAELHNGHKISAIKLVREATGWGLAEAKAYTENVLMPTLGLAPRYSFANAAVPPRQSPGRWRCFSASCSGALGRTASTPARWARVCCTSSRQASSASDGSGT